MTDTDTDILAQMLRTAARKRAYRAALAAVESALDHFGPPDDEVDEYGQPEYGSAYEALCAAQAALADTEVDR